MFDVWSGADYAGTVIESISKGRRYTVLGTTHLRPGKVLGHDGDLLICKHSDDDVLILNEDEIFCGSFDVITRFTPLSLDAQILLWLDSRNSVQPHIRHSLVNVLDVMLLFNMTSLDRVMQVFDLLAEQQFLKYEYGLEKGELNVTTFSSLTALASLLRRLRMYAIVNAKTEAKVWTESMTAKVSADHAFLRYVDIRYNEGRQVRPLPDGSEQNIETALLYSANASIIAFLTERDPSGRINLNEWGRWYHTELLRLSHFQKFLFSSFRRIS